MVKPVSWILDYFSIKSYRSLRSRKFVGSSTEQSIEDNHCWLARCVWAAASRDDLDFTLHFKWQTNWPEVYKWSYKWFSALPTTNKIDLKLMIPTEIGGGKMGSSSQCYGNTRTSTSTTSSSSNVISWVMYASAAAGAVVLRPHYPGYMQPT